MLNLAINLGPRTTPGGWPYGAYDDVNGLGDETSVRFMAMFDQHIGQQGNTVLDETGAHAITFGPNASITANGLALVSPDTEGATIADSPDWMIATGNHFGVAEYLLYADSPLTAVQAIAGQMVTPQRSWQTYTTVNGFLGWQLSQDGTNILATAQTTHVLPAETLYYVAYVIDAGKSPGSGNRYRIYAGPAGVQNGVTQRAEQGIPSVFVPFDSTMPFPVARSAVVRVKGMRVRRIETGFPVTVPGLSEPFTAPLGFGQG